MKTRSSILMVTAVLCPALWASDWPRFLGPAGNGISPEAGINKNWAEKTPKELWRIGMTDGGFSGPAIAGEVVYIHDHKNEQDVIRALNINDGKELWHFAYDEPGDENHGYTRATPTVNDGKVYTVSRTGVVHCIDAATGQKVWRADVIKDHNGKPPEWGAANSAYIDGDRLITIAAGENAHVAALDKNNGKVRKA